MKVRDLMTKEVVTARGDSTLEEVARLLTRHRIRGVPVVDEENRLIGIITKSDLFPKRRTVPFSRVDLPCVFRQFVHPAELPHLYRTVRRVRAFEAMVREVISVDVNADLHQAAELMTRRNLKGLPVLQEGRLAGIITRSDLMKFLAGEET
jgi:CBS domain-containing protein